MLDGSLLTLGRRDRPREVLREVQDMNLWLRQHFNTLENQLDDQDYLWNTMGGSLRTP